MILLLSKEASLETRKEIISGLFEAEIITGEYFDVIRARDSVSPPEELRSYEEVLAIIRQ